jgi:hypothetical protein
MLLQTALSLHLICAGGGSSHAQESATAVRDYDYAHPVEITGRVRVGFNDEVAVDIAGETGRIRVPDAMKPRIRSGGRDGWWELRNISVTDDEIRASFALNFMNHANVRIDRRSGNISIREMGASFNGYCNRYDPADTPMRF